MYCHNHTQTALTQPPYIFLKLAFFLKKSSARRCFSFIAVWFHAARLPDFMVDGLLLLNFFLVQFWFQIAELHLPLWLLLALHPIPLRTVQYRWLVLPPIVITVCPT